MQNAKELSEHELAALGAVSRALDDAVTGPVYLNFIRRFHRTKEVQRNWLLSCTVRFTFGFRQFISDDGGTGSAVVKMCRVLVADSLNLAHPYHVWVPETVIVTFRTGHALIKPEVKPLAHSARKMMCRLGNGYYQWVSYVRLA